MTIHEPLTSAALGRSPYDEVIFPDSGPDNGGEGSSRTHRDRYQQLYDERGRPINPETRRINKDVVRSHNEVMAVIGVAEPEHGTQDDGDLNHRKHNQYEEVIGRRLLHFGGLVETACIWGVNGVRQRILLYKSYARVSFLQTFQLARGEQSLGAQFFAGFPTFALSTWMEHHFGQQARDNKWFNAGMMYIRLHLAAYTFFQRNGILSPTNFLPSWRFFIPGSSVSPIIIPQYPSSFTGKGLLNWIGAVVVGAMPFVGFYFYTEVYNSLARQLRIAIWTQLPRPSNFARNKAISEASQPAAVAVTRAALQPVPPAVTQAASQATSANNSPTQPSTSGTGTQTPTDTPPQRQNTPNNAAARGSSHLSADDFASDDEDVEVSATLISFDVESAEPVVEESSPTTTATTARTPGVWSAELRPTVNDASRLAQLKNEPTYRENMLRRLPATLATDVFACGPARLLTAPMAVLVWTRLCRPYMARLGMSLADVYEPSLFGPFTRQGLLNLLGTELMLVNILGHVWGLVTFIAYRHKLSDEEWDKPPTEEEERVLASQEVLD
ncbi:hypothetical protein QBC35DRAFT_401373 [Podospora australis]|uniref:Uncharacterized protein n=1 Tax=Podospora australis TaxID=1536484 RepID=A0AAN7AK48_9PEZI|nr:hypothetical protein QBC35DRAFT_401373 [Podospora australis]